MGAGRSLQPVVLKDSDGNVIGVLQDGSTYRLQSINKVLNAGGSQINPATQETLASADGKLTTIDAVLDSIKDIDGIKKIVDALPAGTNEIGKVAQGTKAAPADGWPQVLYDDSGNAIGVIDDAGIKRLRVETLQKSGSYNNVVVYDSAGHAVGVVLDGAVYRFQTDAKVAKGSSDLVHLEAIDTVTGEGRLKVTVYTPDGDPAAFGSVSASIKNEFAEDSGSSPDLLVNGSVTPVVFTYDADSTDDISLQEIKFTMVANTISFGSGYFGGLVGGLTNGVLVQVVSSGDTITLINMLQNEDFVNFSSPGGFEWVVSSKDMVTSNYLIGGGLKLHAGTGDQVKITIRDNLSGTAGVYFKCFVKGNLLTEV